MEMILIMKKRVNTVRGYKDIVDEQKGRFVLRKKLINHSALDELDYSLQDLYLILISYVNNETNILGRSDFPLTEENLKNICHKFDFKRPITTINSLIENGFIEKFITDEGIEGYRFTNKGIFPDDETQLTEYTIEYFTRL